MDRPTMPARNSFEERQLEMVQRGRLTLAEAQRNVQKYRELREASMARMVAS